MIPLIINRLKDQVSGLGLRVSGAADLAALMKKGTVPTQTPAAFVMPMGATGREAEVQIGLYRQVIDEMFAVVLCISSRDRTGEKALAEVEVLIGQIIRAVAGWEIAPDAFSNFEFRRWFLARFADGVAVYEIHFILPEQLRIDT